jgi:peptidoglycan/LPS O-acetylase OafA/YrhL
MTPGAFRLMLASLVVVHHFTPLSLGSAAVGLFFVLSGFWIRTMWQNKYRHTHRPYLTFITSRFWRLFPAFIFVAVVTALVTNCSKPIGLQWLPNIAILGYGQLACMPVAPVWSLDVELQFYFVAPIVIFFAAKGNGALAALVLAGVLGVILGSYLAPGRHFYFNIGPGAVLYDAFLFFLVGMIASSASWRPPRALVLGSTALAIALIAIVLAHPIWRSILLIGAHPGALADFNPLANAAVIILLTPLALSTVTRPSNAIDRTAGDLAYIVYLVHWPVMIYVRDRFYAGADTKVHLLILAVAIPAIFLISLFLLFVLDRPMNRLRSAFVNGRLARRPQNARAGAPAASRTPSF